MWPNPQEPAHLVTFTEENLNGKLNFLCSVTILILYIHSERNKRIWLLRRQSANDIKSNITINI